MATLVWELELNSGTAALRVAHSVSNKGQFMFILIHRNSSIASLIGILSMVVFLLFLLLPL